MKLSTQGYKKNSPDKEEKELLIPSGHITTKDMAFPIMANNKILYPDTGDYFFPEGIVYEKPIMQSAGQFMSSLTGEIAKSDTRVDNLFQQQFEPTQMSDSSKADVLGKKAVDKKNFNMNFIPALGIFNTAINKFSESQRGKELQEEYRRMQTMSNMPAMTNLTQYGQYGNPYVYQQGGPIGQPQIIVNEEDKQLLKKDSYTRNLFGDNAEKIYAAGFRPQTYNNQLVYTTPSNLFMTKEQKRMGYMPNKIGGLNRVIINDDGTFSNADDVNMEAGQVVDDISRLHGGRLQQLLSTNTNPVAKTSFKKGGMQIGGVVPEFSQFSPELLGQELPAPSMQTPVIEAPMGNVATENVNFKGNSKEKTNFVFNYLKSKGIPDHAAAGITGNLAIESGYFDDNVVSGKKKGDQGKAVGIAQWHPDRWNALMKWSKTQNSNPFVLETQLDYVVHEASQRGDLDKTIATPNAEEAAYVFGKKFERPNDKYAHWGKRKGVARNLTQYKEGGEYIMSPDELLEFLDNGGQVEFITD